MNPPESSRCEALSNSTRCSGAAHASAISAGMTQPSISMTAARKMTALGNALSLQCAARSRPFNRRIVLRRLGTVVHAVVAHDLEDAEILCGWIGEQPRSKIDAGLRV